MPTAEQRLEPGAILSNRLRVEDCLSQSSYSSVYLCCDSNDSSKFSVIKVPHAALLASQGGIEAFRYGLAIQNSLSHPGIVAVRGFCDFEGLPACELEHINGWTLEQRLLAAGPVTVPQGVGILAQLALATHALHGAGLLHCNLEPSNVLLSITGRACITDFRVAGPKLAESEFHPSLPMAYLSPEFLEASKVDERFDIYSLGALAYLLFTGTTPYSYEEESQYLYARLKSDVIDPSTFRADLPAEIDIIISKALARNPELRYQSALELYYDLRFVAQSICQPAAYETAPFDEFLSTAFDTDEFEEECEATEERTQVQPFSFIEQLTRPEDTTIITLSSLLPGGMRQRLEQVSEQALRFVAEKRILLLWKYLKIKEAYEGGQLKAETQKSLELWRRKLQGFIAPLDRYDHLRIILAFVLFSLLIFSLSSSTEDDPEQLMSSGAESSPASSVENSIDSLGDSLPTLTAPNSSVKEEAPAIKAEVAPPVATLVLREDAQTYADQLQSSLSRNLALPSERAALTTLIQDSNDFENPLVAKLLVQALQHDEPVIRAEALRALSNEYFLARAEVLTAVLRMSEDPDFLVRAFAAKSLLGLNSSSALKVLEIRRSRELHPVAKEAITRSIQVMTERLAKNEESKNAYNEESD